MRRCGWEELPGGWVTRVWGGEGCMWRVCGPGCAGTGLPPDWSSPRVQEGPPTGGQIYTIIMRAELTVPLPDSIMSM